VRPMRGRCTRCGPCSRMLPPTVNLRSLDGDGLFRANPTNQLLKPSGIKTTSWGDRQVDRIKMFTRLHVARSSLAPWRLPSVARSFASVASPDWLRSRVHSGGPSSLSSQPNRATKAAIDFSIYGAHADMLGARFGVRAAEDGHLTLLRAHAAVAHVGCCSCHPPNAWKCHRGL
jgi:hypothetical protein